MITILGIQIHEFSIALSDLILFMESGIFAYLIYRRASGGLNFKTIQGLSFFLFMFLSISSLLGSLFHAFFPQKTDTVGGLIIWMMTAISIGLIATVMWYLNTHLLKKEGIYRYINYFAGLFLIVYLITILFIDYHYPTIIKFYTPPILLLGLISMWRLVSTKKSIWLYLTIGIILTIVAAVVQFLHIGFNSNYLNFNTIYHLIQAAALLFLFIFFWKENKLLR
jgi:hypothetical protein